MPMPVEPRAEIRGWRFKAFQKHGQVTGFVFNDKEEFYTDGTKVTLNIKSRSEYNDHYIVKTISNTFLLKKSEQVLR